MTVPMRTRICDVMSLVFNLPAVALGDNPEIMQVRGWDSLGHAQLMLALEEAFEVSISQSDVIELQSLDEIEVFLTTRGTN